MYIRIDLVGQLVNLILYGLGSFLCTASRMGQDSVFVVQDNLIGLHKPLQEVELLKVVCNPHTYFLSCYLFLVVMESKHLWDDK